MEKDKPKKTFYTVLGVIGDCLFFPIIIISLIVTCVVFMDRRQNELPSFFGVSLVKILSGSMTKSGFRVGDTVFVKKCPMEEIWLGDILAFYSNYDEVDIKLYNQDKLIEITNKDQIVKKDDKIVFSGRSSLEDVQKKKAKVIFHEVIGIYYDEAGTRFFKTKGSSNGSPETYPIREDLVVGRYSNTPVVFRDIMRWVASPIGMIILVCFPLGILVILQSLSLIEQVNFIMIEKHLLRQQISWKDDEAKRLFKSTEMEELAKIIYLTKVKADERREVASLMWNLDREHLTEKQKKYYYNVDQSINLLETKGVQHYLVFWKNNLKSKRERAKLEDEMSMLIIRGLRN